MISHYIKNSKYPQDDWKFDSQIAHKNADWVLGTWANCFKMSARGWKRYYLISIQHHRHRMESSREQRWDSGDKYTLCCKTAYEGIYNMRPTDAWFAISELPRKFFCVIVAKSYLFDQRHSHVAYHSLIMLQLFFYFVNTGSHIFFRNWRCVPLEWPFKQRKQNPLQRILGSWLYSRCWISRFIYFPNLVFFRITEKVAILKSCKYTLVVAKQYFLKCSLSRALVHWEMSKGFTAPASIRQ